MTKFQQIPIRNASVIGAQVYSHNGEYAPQVTDFSIDGRGIDLRMIRKYSSAQCNSDGLFGKGWSFNYDQKIIRSNKNVIYRNGFGQEFIFLQSANNPSFYESKELYSVIEITKDKTVLKLRKGVLLIFELPECGGRLLQKIDRNGNGISLLYNRDGIEITDTLKRKIRVIIKDGLIVSIQAPMKRVWKYNYNSERCLTEVIQTSTKQFPKGTNTKYSYNKLNQLISVTNPNGDTFLQNQYDKEGRIEIQKHGAGTYLFQYKKIGTTKEEIPIYETFLLRKNGSQLLLTHNNTGQVIERKLLVNGGTDSLVTKSKFNSVGELLERIFPAGDVSVFEYDESNNNVRAQGNLIKKIRKSSNIVNSQISLVNEFAYEEKFQRVKSSINTVGRTTNFNYDKNGNLIQKVLPQVTINQIGNFKKAVKTEQLTYRFEYNKSGQLIKAINSAGALKEYFYYPEEDFNGSKGFTTIHSDAKKSGGYMARIVTHLETSSKRISKSSKRTKSFQYDLLGNIISSFDGKLNGTSFKYDEQNNLTEIISRKPFNNKLLLQYDANRNLKELKFTIQHNSNDNITGKRVAKNSTFCRRFNYNSLDNIIQESIVTANKEITFFYFRDGNENLIRSVNPLGKVNEYEYEERNLLKEARFGVGSKEEIKNTYEYSPNGRLTTFVDGNGNTKNFRYDELHRYIGYTNAVGTSKRIIYDEAGNKSRIQLVKNGEAENVLAEKLYQYDELDRCTRIDNSWFDSTSGKTLGKSNYDGQIGIISTIIQNDANHLPAKIWTESGNILSFKFDGSNKLSELKNIKGDTMSCVYDENGNIISFELTNNQNDSFKNTKSFKYDSLDRLIFVKENEKAPFLIQYNKTGLVNKLCNPLGTSLYLFHDELGRISGHSMEAITPKGITDASKNTMLNVKYERDDLNRLTSITNCAGKKTSYQYDSLNRLCKVIFPDGTIKSYSYDGNNNCVKSDDAKKNSIKQSFDANNRLISSQLISSGEVLSNEEYVYDGMNRIVRINASDFKIDRSYDSLSRLLQEIQSGKSVKHSYDSAGNRIYTNYPGGEKLYRVFNELNLTTEVKDGKKKPISSFTFRAFGLAKEQKIGTVLKANYDFKKGESKLREVIYQSAQNNKIISRKKYEYDENGNVLSEEELNGNSDDNKNFIYDSADRLISVQYGLKNAKSSFTKEITYQLSPIGTWAKKITRNSKGKIVELADGLVDDRAAYLSLGSKLYKQDANGNRISELDEKEQTRKMFSYDIKNRLIKIEHNTIEGSFIQTIEYSYDSLDRQISKKIKNISGTNNYQRVFDGDRLIEEWLNDKLQFTFLYNDKTSSPVKIVDHTNGGKEYFYTYNLAGFPTLVTDGKGIELVKIFYDENIKPNIATIGAIERETINHILIGNGSIMDMDVELFFSNPYDPNSGHQNPTTNDINGEMRGYLQVIGGCVAISGLVLAALGGMASAPITGGVSFGVTISAIGAAITISSGLVQYGSSLPNNDVNGTSGAGIHDLEGPDKPDSPSKPEEDPDCKPGMDGPIQCLEKQYGIGDGGTTPEQSPSNPLPNKDDSSDNGRNDDNNTNDDNKDDQDEREYVDDNKGEGDRPSDEGGESSDRVANIMEWARTHPSALGSGGTGDTTDMGNENSDKAQKIAEWANANGLNLGGGGTRDTTDMGNESPDWLAVFGVMTGGSGDGSGDWDNAKIFSGWGYATFGAPRARQGSNAKF